jgi:CDP-6-deoxy-D-xylo-4-hexulose-3-dehydrase
VSPTESPDQSNEEQLNDLREAALEAVRAYGEAASQTAAFVAGETFVSVAGKSVGAPEMAAVADAVMDAWLTEGRFAARFRPAFAEVAGGAHCSLVGSGSQANLLAIAAATSHLHGDKRWRPGDEVITAAVGFPTTVNPLYQHGLVPVYVDIDVETFNPSVEAIAAAIGPRTRGIVLAHFLGNPFDARALEQLCAEHDLVLIEDCCDALGSTLGGRPVGSFGAAATYSFYPAHHMTMGEGGAVCTQERVWAQAVASLREWGRDCWCPTGVSDACGARFDGQFGTLPVGYDHKYVFSHVGFNFKVTDMQAAMGLAQLDRLPGIGASRRRNFALIAERMAGLSEHVILPRSIEGADPSWFGFPFTLRDGGPARRNELQRFLMERRIDSRLLLAGNMTRQPAYEGLEHRIAGSLEVADRITESSVWIGCHPQLTEPMIDWMCESVAAFVGG